MSTRTRKGASATSGSRESSQEKSSSKKNTPLSPARVTRLDEKKQLQNLNDRLATYIDRVRFLEGENNRLGSHVTTIEEKYEREIRNSKEVYEKEINSLRNGIDVTANEKAQALLELKNFKVNHADLQKKFQKKEKDLAAAEKSLGNLEVRTQDLQNELNHIISENKRQDAKAKETEQEKKNLEALLSKTRSDLDASTLQITDLQNRIQSLKEELSFKETIYEKELSDSRIMKTVEISSIDASVREDYDLRLAESLKDLRNQYESQMKLSSEEIISIYEQKLFDLQNECDNRIKSSHGKEDRTNKSKLDYFSSKVSELESQIEALKHRIKDLEAILEQEREWHKNVLQDKAEELKNMREESQRQLTEYQDLLGIKVALDMEIAAYRKLLEGEEARLNISRDETGQTRATPSRHTPMRSTKRKRTFFESGQSTSDVTASAKGDVQIIDHDGEGKYIKLHNKGSTEIPLGGWQLLRKAGEQENIYKFSRNTAMKPNAYITVWSSDAGTAHNPPTDYLMKGQKWFVSDTMSSVLLNNNGEEMAVRETSKKMIKSMEQRILETGSYSEYPGEELYHQQGGRERCLIM